ncbi:MAG TPA: Holliday junction branch migration protein RuvA [Clostridia bacterium]|nr:Holliday junction branch migration protein RuvA [Clostridia bacterium]
MIDYIKGIVKDTGENFIVVENNGIGYRIFTSMNTIGEISDGDELKIYADMVVREDDISLYGFYDKSELKMFRMLNKVNGIGSKLALAVLSTIDYNDVARCIALADSASLTSVSGVGKKTAQRIILDLKDKVIKEFGEMDMPESVRQGRNLPSKGENRDAVDALMALGYGRTDASTAVQSVYEEGMKAQTIIKEALKTLLKR